MHNQQAHPPSEAQQLADARKATEVAQDQREQVVIAQRKELEESRTAALYWESQYKRTFDENVELRLQAQWNKERYLRVIAQLWVMVGSYRRAYGVLHSAARGVLGSAEMAHGYTDEHTVVGSEALRELARCVSSNGGDMP